MATPIPHSGSELKAEGVLSTFNHNPGANTQATVTLAAPGAGLRWVITMLKAKFVAGGSAPTAVNVNFNVIAGASGGTPIQSDVMGLDGTAGRDGGFIASDAEIPIPLNTACTIEFSAAGGANTSESINGTAKVVAG